MKNLRSLNKYFVKYKWHLSLGLLFITISNLFGVLPPAVVRQVVDSLHVGVNMQTIYWFGLELLMFALLRGVFMFLMRQTIIVMSRHIEYDQKNEVYEHYQKLDTKFFKMNYTGDLMNRISEDVARVRMYTGPSIMYFSNMLVFTVMSIWCMVRVNLGLTLWVIIPLPLLAIAIYIVNEVIFNKSGKIQAQLSVLTTNAHETYSGIRVIKSFVQEGNMSRFFEENSERYRKSAVNLSLTEAFYFPTMNLFIALSMLITILVGGYYAIHGYITMGNIAEFVMYTNSLMFPIMSIGMVASMTQRAGASQKRIDEFLNTQPEIFTPENAVKHNISGGFSLHHLTFTYPHTGITALADFSLDVMPGEKIAIMGKTGSGKSTIAHLLLRMYDVTSGKVQFDGLDINTFDLKDLRSQIAYTPQDVFLFSDTIYNNIKFGKDNATEAEIYEAVRLAALEKEIAVQVNGYATVVGERGVMLSGGQKQRMVLARALLKKSPILLLDDCLSAVDSQTEHTILTNLKISLSDTTVLVITHRIFSTWTFDKIVMLDNGRIAEQGTHEELIALNGAYAKLYRHQTNMG